MIKVIPFQTVTVFIRPHHHCGEQVQGLVRRKMAMILDSGDTAEISVKDHLPVWHTLFRLVFGYLEGNT